MFITSTAIAAFVAASISAGVTLYAYFAGKKDGYRKGLEEGFDKGFTKASSFTPPPPAFDKNTCMFDMLGLLAMASALSGFGSKKNTADHMPETVPVPQTPAEEDIDIRPGGLNSSLS